MNNVFFYVLLNVSKCLRDTLTPVFTCALLFQRFLFHDYFNRRHISRIRDAYFLPRFGVFFFFVFHREFIKCTERINVS